MPVINVAAAPFRLDRPSLVLDHGGTDPIQLQCQARLLDWQSDQEFDDVESFCNPKGEAPAAVTRSINLDVNHSFGDPAGALPGLWNVLQPLEGTVQTFALLLNGTAAVSHENPEASGQVWIPNVPFIGSAGVQKFSQYTLEFRLFNVPVYATDVGSAVYASHT